MVIINAATIIINHLLTLLLFSNLKVKKNITSSNFNVIKKMFENQRAHRLIRQNKTKQNYLFARSVELHVVTHSAFKSFEQKSQRLNNIKKRFTGRRNYNLDVYAFNKRLDLSELPVLENNGCFYLILLHHKLY